ncbi:aminodeoxychorismate lyase [Herbiconiux sp. CPCC 203407]|uniref:Aminodeoxychorismate lyase n=1 Tax=Herbiconiux oxytropis TaxID=2970915 RepID=A0AA42BUP9_9MICO|nr:aminodeoxychorismate lyase [Herbiconiux oxytropis]MCS5722215.1 aminodeoxychorismate lyase [Herbiconiux oxytropis]MCS5727147.1 aminodeoxychorismate lyase [Herbiconiux oxytropis]
MSGGVSGEDLVVFVGTGTGADGVGPVLPMREAAVNVADLAVTRGDGVFESIGVIDGRFIELPRHLARLKHSAAMLDLPEPDVDAFARAARLAVGAHAPQRELLVKLLHSRGIEGSDRASGWVQVLFGTDHSEARSTGIRVVTLDRGYRHDIAQTSPWLLQGAKTLSYALNKAALREAARRDADDVIFVSTDDVVLEGPTSNVLVRHGDLFRTPRPDLGILAGTTQAAVFETLGALGFETSEAVMAPAELATADGVWLLSSGRLIAPVRELDGRSLPVDAAFTRTLLERTFGL